MKKKLLALIASKEEQRKNLNAALIDSDSKEERAAIGETLSALGKEIADLEAMLSEVDEPAEPTEAGATDPANEEGRKFDVLGTMQQRNAQPVVEDATSTLEYRKAFQKYIATGDKAEFRATTKTTDTNISTVIPQNLADRILEKIEQLGVILNKVTKTSLPVGIAYSVDGLKPTATWVGKNTTTPSSSTSGEGAGSTAQGKTLGALITFASYKLRCEIRMTEEVSVMTLPMFEALFVKQVSEAMVRAKEFAVVEGDGYGMPKGILAATPTETYTITAGDMPTYANLCAIEALVPAEYENTAAWCMTKKTFMTFAGMVDTVGQPIARTNYGIDGKIERTLLGREVVIYAPQANSSLKTLSASSVAGDVVAFIFNFSDYVLNENYNLGIQHAVDWDNEDHKTKAVLACDGKVIISDSLIKVSVAAKPASSS